METEKMIMELRRIAKNHKNDRLCTGELNLTDMCTDVADRLEEQIAIVNKAALKGWKEFYPPTKKKNSSGKKQISNNKFNNFHQREYDYEKLEAGLLGVQEGEIKNEDRAQK